MKNNILSNFQQISAFKDSPFEQFWEKRLPPWAVETYGSGYVYNKSNFRIIDASKRFSDWSVAFYNKLVDESWNDIQFLVFAHPDGNQVLKDYADSKKAPKENEVYFFIETNDGKLDFGKIVRVKLGKKAITKITSAYPLVSGWNQEDLVNAFLKRSFEVKKGIDYDFVKAGEEIKKNPEEFKNLLAKAIKYDYQQKKFDDMSWGLKFLQLTDSLGFSIPQKLMQLSGEMRAKKYSEEKFWNAKLPKDFTPAFLPNAIVPEKRNNIKESILKNVKERINEITSYGKEAGLLEQVYKEILNNVLLYLFDKFSSALEEGLKSLDDILPNGEILNDLYNLNAFLVGLWNGCIEFVAGIVDLVALIIVIERDGFGYAISDKLTEQLENFFNEAIFGFEDFVLKLWKKFNIAIKDFELWYLQYSDNSYYWYKTLGELTPDILTIIVPELAASKVAKVSKAGTVVTEVSEDVLRKSGKVLSEKLEQTTAKKEVKEAFEKAETKLEDNVPKENKIEEIGFWMSKELQILFKNEDFKKIYKELANGTTKRAFRETLLLEEEAVLRFYTTNSGYKNFNKALRGEMQMTEFYRTQEKLMNQALEKLPAYKEQGFLYRIENLSEEQVSKIYKKGGEITNKNFTSSSYDDFAIGKAMERRAYTILIRIESKNGRLIESLSTFNQEKEVLFKSGTKFYVDDIRMSTSPEDYMTPIKTIILKEK